MPEGPEIRLAADKVAAALVGHEITRVAFAFDRLRKFESRLCGRRVIDVRTRGKAMLTCFDNDWVIYSHNQLYGRWFTCRQGVIPDTRRQLRAEIHNRKNSAFLYSASDIDVLHHDELDQHPFLSRLGPDILSDKPDARLILERMLAPQFHNRQLAGLLLDQSFLAGLGNYLRAEILTLARLHPSRRPVDCSREQLQKLARLIIRTTHRSYRTRGIVNPPGLVRQLRSQGKSARAEYRFNSYGREGEPCHYCGERIRCANAGGRKMYFCPGCQPAPERVEV
ncbi:MAG: endonuclease VIII [Gammaproteobacteria bacterium]|nr:endonuclease VIII [Gammaproteobacteria bacterium]MDH3448603.1 endonuclease VIII [Gammaproteobacteria bacterium]